MNHTWDQLVVIERLTLANPNRDAGVVSAEFAEGLACAVALGPCEANPTPYPPDTRAARSWLDGFCLGVWLVQMRDAREARSLEGPCDKRGDGRSGAAG